MTIKITVTDRYVDPTGKPVRGQVLFTPSIRFTDVDGAATVAVNPVAVPLNVNGVLSVDLTATTGPDVTPPGWVWHVREQLTGATSRSDYDIALPYDGPSTVILRELAPVPDFTPVVWAPETVLTYNGGTP